MLIVTFVAKIKDHIELFFAQVLMICEREGLNDRNMFAIDGSSKSVRKSIAAILLEPSKITNLPLLIDAIAGKNWRSSIMESTLTFFFASCSEGCPLISKVTVVFAFISLWE